MHSGSAGPDSPREYSLPGKRSCVSFLVNKELTCHRSDPASDLTAHLGYWLRYVSNHVSQAFARKVEAHGVTVAEWVLMRQLLDGEALAPKPARRAHGHDAGRYQ